MQSRARIPRMGRPRKNGNGLPARVYSRGGALYYVVPGTEKWLRLGPDNDRPACMRRYAELLNEGANTFAAVAERYRTTILIRKAPATQKKQNSELNRLIAVFGKLSIDSIRRGHIARYRDERGKSAPVSANRELALMSHVLSRALEWELVRENVCRGVEKLEETPRDRYITDDEFRAVYNVGNTMTQVMMGLALVIGQRGGDLLRIRRSDIGDDGILVKQGKGSRKLLITWTPALAAVVEQAGTLPRAGVISTYLVSQANGQPYTEDGFRTAWQRHIVKCFDKGLISERFTFHDIRAKAGTDGTDEKLLGHLDSRMMKRVYRRKPEAVKPVR